MNDFVLSIPKMGYFILFKHKGDFISRQIEKEQRNRGFKPEEACFTHVGVSGGGQWMVQVSAPNIKVVDITECFNGRYVRIVRYKSPDYEGRKGAKVAFWAASKCNLRYDWFGVLRFKIKLLIQWQSRQFCSENSAWALQKEYGQVALYPKRPYDCMPADFTNPDFFETVWEGAIT